MADDSKKRLLALDGGGVLGLVTVMMLERVEDQLREAYGGDPDFRLRDFFDYIGGTSTGAIIAAGLALGKSIAELKHFYVNSGEQMFDRASLLKRWRYTYAADNLRDLLKQEFGAGSILELQRDGSLSSEKHLLVVTRNVNTDSPWPVSTNPSAKYNDESRADCNRLLPLWQLVRASTAAPTFFAPEHLTLSDTLSFVFEDGGVTAYNNPAFLLYRMATEPAYHCEWASGEDKMMLLSLGTGLAFRTLEDPDMRGEGLIATAKTVPSELMRGIALEQDISCRTIGRCTHGPAIDSEIDDLVVAPDPNRPKAFLYARYDTDISQDGLAAAGLGDIDAATLVMDNASAVPALLRIGEVAARQVNIAEQFPGFVP